MWKGDEIVIGNIIDIVIPLVSVAVTELVVTKRERKNSQNEMCLLCLQEYINWIDEVSIDIKKLSREVENCLNKKNPEERREREFMTKEEYNVLNERILTFTSSHAYVNNATSIDLGMRDFGKKLCKLVLKLYKLVEDYIKVADNKQALDVNSSINKEIDKLIEEQCYLISNEIKKLIGGK